MTEQNSRSWRKSSFSGGGGPGGGNCVEVAFLGSDGLAVRDSKNRTQGALLLTEPAARSWIADIKDGRLDLPR